MKPQEKRDRLTARCRRAKRALTPGCLTGARSETAERSVDARKPTEAAAGVVVHYVEAADGG